MSGLCKRVGCGETTEPRADDDVVETKRGAVAAVEWREFLGGICVVGVRMVLHVSGGKVGKWGGSFIQTFRSMNPGVTFSFSPLLGI